MRMILIENVSQCIKKRSKFYDKKSDNNYIFNDYF